MTVKTSSQINKQPNVKRVWRESDEISGAEWWFELEAGWQVENDQRHLCSAETEKELCEMYNNCVTKWDNDPQLKTL